MKARRSVASRIAHALTYGAVCLVSSLSFGNEIKKQTQLICPNDRMALMVAEAKSTRGDGHGLGANLIKGAAEARGIPVPAELPPDPDQDDNEDYTKSSYLAARSLCHLSAGDKIVVIGIDGEKVLVEVRGKSYLGRRVYPTTSPEMSGGSLIYREAGEQPACLNRTKLWIERNVFVVLKQLPVPIDPARQLKQANELDKAAVQRAVGKH